MSPLRYDTSRAKIALERTAARWPNTHHPALRFAAAAVTTHLDACTSWPTALMIAVEPEDDLPISTEEPELLLLTIRTWYGPAPYVGEPAVYLWPVAYDLSDRWIAGSAVYVPTGIHCARNP